MGIWCTLSPHWFEYAWPPEWFYTSIMAKELVPILSSVVLFGPHHWHRNKYSFNVITKAWLWSLTKVQKKKLLGCTYSDAYDYSFDSQTTATHLPGVCNSAADMLSWNQRTAFLIAHHQASQTSSPLCHHPLMCFLSSQMFNWTSTAFQIQQPHQEH